MDESLAEDRAAASGSPAIRLRTVRADDGDFLDAMAARLFPHSGPGTYSLDEALAGTRRVLREAAAAHRDGELFEVAENENGERLGFIYVVTVQSFFTGEAHAHISEIVVARDRLGVGAVLIRRAEAWARERGYRRMTLNVMRQNTRARAFYEHHGYDLEMMRYSKAL